MRARFRAALFLFSVATAFAGCKRSASTSASTSPSVAASSAALAPAPPSQPLPPREERFSDAGMLAESAKFIGSDAFRRAALESEFTNRENTYARVRLASYARVTSGWDLLPEWTPRSVPLTGEHAAAFVRGEAVTLPASTAPIWDGKTPVTMAEWVALGERMFFTYPMRAEVFLRFAVERPEIGERVGVVRASDGTYPGSVLFIDDSGRTEVGLTCAQCHSRVVQGVTHAGEARREFDYGRLRLRYHEVTKAPVDPELARRMAKWGPGRADVTEDEAEDPVTIPDLWGLRAQSTLTQAGTIVHAGPTALAIRQETQLIQTNHERVRPPRVIAWALAMYLYSLAPPSDEGHGARNAADPALAKGRAVFDGACRSCHSNAAYGGELVNAADVGTDRELAHGRARGTGKYRPPALLRVRDGAPYLHDGSVASLEDLLGTRRLSATHPGPLGARAAPGHLYGTKLVEADRTALLAFLRSL